MYIDIKTKYVIIIVSINGGQNKMKVQNVKRFGNLLIDSFNEVDGKNILVASGIGGSSITEDIIPDAISAIRLLGADEVHLKGLNGVDLVITPDMSAKDAKNVWETEQKRKDEEYEKSPEYKDQQKKMRAEEKERKEFEFATTTEAIDTLKKVKEIPSLTTDKASLEEAVDFCKDVMLVIAKMGQLHFSDSEQKEISKLLKQKGACRTKELNEKFKEVKGDSSVGVLMDLPNNIQFPVCAFDQLIDTKPDTFSFGLSYMNDGGKNYSWVCEWLKVQDKSKNTDSGK
jgi:hypothetical protein